MDSIPAILAASERWRRIVQGRRLRHLRDGDKACDESCTSCSTCYRVSGLETCGRLCAHAAENFPPEDEE